MNANKGDIMEEKTKECFCCGNILDINAGECPRCGAEQVRIFTKEEKDNIKEEIDNINYETKSAKIVVGVGLLLFFIFGSLFSELGVWWVSIIVGVVGSAIAFFARWYYKRKVLPKKGSNVALLNGNVKDDLIGLVNNEEEIEKRSNKMEYLAGVGSTVTFRVLEDDETCQVTIVEPMDKKDYNQVSKFSELGKALMDCKKGDEIKVNAIEPYAISILYVSSPVKKRIVQQPLKREIVQQPQPKTHSKPIDNSNEQSLNGSKLGEDFILAQSGDYANFQSEVSDGLQLKHAYGTRAEDIYLDGVFCFGWNYAKRESFGRQQKLYDVNCTEDGYSVLFLPYSNLNDGRNEKVSWTDFISSDFKTIKEVWKDTDKENFYDRTKRITFAKQKNGQYIYIGIFQAKIIDEEAKCKYYKRIGDEYFGN